MGVDTPNPSSSFVLIGFVKSEEHYTWIQNNGLYNLRLNSGSGSIRLTPQLSGARYLLLHKEGQLITFNIHKITKSGPRIFSKAEMQRLVYPNPGNDFYLVFNIDSQGCGDQFSNARWDIRKMKEYQAGHLSASPWVVSLTSLMAAKIMI